MTDIFILLALAIGGSVLWGLWGLVRAEIARRVVEDALLQNQFANLKHMAKQIMAEKAEDERKARGKS